MQTLPSPASCCSPCDDQVTTQIPGPQGLSAYQVAVEDGFVGTISQWLDSLIGENGENSYTALTAAFTQPAVAATAVATVVSSGWAVIGEDVFMEGGGYYEVTAIADSTHVTLRNRGYNANSAPATVVPIGSRISPSGEKGEDGTNAAGDMLYADNLNAMASNDASLGNLGGTAAGLGFFKMVSPSAVTFPRINADNTVTARTAANFRTDLGVVIGTDVQAYDADLTTWAGLTPSANAQSFVTAANNAAMRTSLGVIAADYALYQHQQTLGTEGGTFTSGAWRTVPLTTEVADTNNIGTLAANEVTLVAGTYRFQGWTSAYAVDNVQGRLYNVTTGSVISYGRCAVSSGASTQFAYVEGRFTIAVSTVVRMEAQCSTTAITSGFGKALSFGTEVYAGLTFIKE